MTDRPETGRFCLQARPDASYNVEGLESLAYNGLLDRDTPIAREGTTDFRPVRSWAFASAVFPEKKPLTFTQSPFDTAVVPGTFKVTRVVLPLGTHITSMEEIKALIRHDPHDPRVLVLLNRLKERMHAEGLSVEQVFADFFAANLALNQRLVEKSTYRQVSDALRTNRWAALIAGIVVDTLLGATVVWAEDAAEAQLALGFALGLTAVLCFFAVFAYQIDRWLHVHPILAGLILMLLISSGLMVVEMCCIYNSDYSLLENASRVVVGHY